MLIVYVGFLGTIEILWISGGYLFIGGLLAVTYFILLLLLFDPQGDAFQKGT